jgi:hypothetical protein
MSALAGDLLEARVQHPTLGNHVFYPKSNESVSRDPGGFRTNDDANQITSAGMITQINRVRGHMEMVVANDDNIRLDADFVASLMKDPVDGEWTFSHVSGVTYGGTGRPVGDIQPDLNAGTFTLKVACPQLVKIG